MRGRPDLGSRSAREPLASDTIEDRCLLETETLVVGTFRAHPSHPEFRHAGRITRPLFVFPRKSVWIRREGRDPFVADPTLAVFYNPGQPYEREKLDEEGDRSDWFSFAPQVFAEALRAYDPRIEDRLDRPFSIAHGPADRRSFWLERSVFEHVRSTGRPDLLYVEETMLRVLVRLVDGAHRSRGETPKSAPAVETRRAVELAHRAKAVLAERFREALTLADIARSLDVSVFHLCRVFRRAFGTSLHRYRNELRLRAALDLLGDFRDDLTGLALHLGFSSHSHFTASFRKAFRCTPSEARRRLVPPPRPGRLRRTPPYHGLPRPAAEGTARNR